MIDRVHLLSFFFLLLSLLYCASPTQAAKPATPIRIASIFAHSGIAMHSDEPAINGTRFAVEEINNSGGINGRLIQLLELDNKSTPIGSHMAALEAIKHGVVGIIGASWSSHSLAIARVAQKNHTVMISPSSTLPSLTSVGDYIFRVCYNDNFQAKALATFAINDLRMRRAIVFTDVASDFSINLSELFCETFQRLGGEVAATIEYKPDSAALLANIHRARAFKADLVFLSGHDESGFIAAHLKENKVRAIPLGSDGWDADSFFTRGGKTIEQGYYLNHWMPNPDDPASLTFLERYKGRGDIKAATALAYDAVNIFATALKKSGADDRTTIRNALYEIKDFPGLTGKISFDAQGDAAKTGCMVEIRSGAPHFLKFITD